MGFFLFFSWCACLCVFVFLLGIVWKFKMKAKAIMSMKMTSNKLMPIVMAASYILFSYYKIFESGMLERGEKAIN